MQIYAVKNAIAPICISEDLFIFKAVIIISYLLWWDEMDNDLDDNDWLSGK